MGAAAADEQGWLATHHFCSPARPELLRHFLHHADPSAISRVIDHEDVNYMSAMGLVVRGSSPAQQQCLAQLLRVNDASLNLRRTHSQAPHAPN